MALLTPLVHLHDIGRQSEVAYTVCPIQQSKASTRIKTHSCGQDVIIIEKLHFLLRAFKHEFLNVSVIACMRVSLTTVSTQVDTLIWSILERSENRSGTQRINSRRQFVYSMSFTLCRRRSLRLTDGITDRWHDRFNWRLSLRCVNHAA